jgi:membrane-associated phospholipid phosphatase
VRPRTSVENEQSPYRGPLGASPLPLERRAGYLPADFVAVIYLTVVLILMAIGRGRLDHWRIWIGVHLAVLAGVWALRFVPRRGLPLFQMLRETYGLFLMPAAYFSVATLNRIPHSGYFDDVALRWDQAIFGLHPHIWLGTHLTWRPLYEFLHLSYLVYILLVPTLAFTLFFQKRFEALRAFATTQMLTMYGCYLVFIFFPVQGPWHTFAHPPLRDGAFFPRLVHAMVNVGGSRGTAFPSSHVAGATTVAIMAYRFSRRLSYAMGILVLSITVATVYGGFHYGVDALAGLGFGIVVALSGPRLHAWILRRIRLAVIRLRFPHLRFYWRAGRIRGEVVRSRGGQGSR